MGLKAHICDLRSSAIPGVKSYLNVEDKRTRKAQQWGPEHAVPFWLFSPGPESHFEEVKIYCFYYREYNHKIDYLLGNWERSDLCK